MTDANPSPDGSPADLLLVIGRIATQHNRQSFVNALAVKDGRIQATGDAATVMTYRGADDPPPSDGRLRLVQWSDPKDLQAKMVAKLVSALALARPERPGRR